jgi:hypothetical protein
MNVKIERRAGLMYRGSYTITIDGYPVGTIDINHRGTAFVLSFRRRNWRSRNRYKDVPTSTMYGQSCIWVKRLKDAKVIAETVCFAYGEQLKINK